MKQSIIFLSIVSLLVFSGGQKNDVPKPVKREKIIFENFSNQSFTENNNQDSDTTPISLTLKLTYDDFVPSTIDEVNEETVVTQREKLLSEGKAYHSRMNDQLADTIDLMDFENVYVSRYSPFISIETNWNELSQNELLTINNLALYDEVEQIFVSKEEKQEPTLEMAKYSLGLSDYQFNRISEFDGEGIVVGLLEPGIINKKHANFANSNVQVRDEWYYFETIKDHTTMMGSIIAGSTGIAPKCKLLSVELSGDAVSEVDWMLDRGVNIINMSYGDKNPTGNYSSNSAYMDYIAFTYKVTMVAAAGNSGTTTAYVSNPGIGYNVVTVGSCTSSDGFAQMFSSHIVNNGPRKPNIMAPGTAITIPGFGGGHNGTSISTAITTGCIALLMQNNYMLRFHPEQVMSVLSASSTRAGANYFGNGLNNLTGAGKLSYTNLLKYNITNNVTFGFTTQTFARVSNCISATQGQTIRVAAAWLAKANGKANGTTKTNYDLYLLDSNGMVVTKQETTDDCLELIEIKAPHTGKYSVEVRQKGTKAHSEEYVALTFFTE